MIHSVSQPIAVACNSCLFENILLEHFTLLKFFLAGLGPQISACVRAGSCMCRAHATALSAGVGTVLIPYFCVDNGGGGVPMVSAQTTAANGPFQQPTTHIRTGTRRVYVCLLPRGPPRPLQYRTPPPVSSGMSFDAPNTAVLCLLDPQKAFGVVGAVSGLRGGWRHLGWPGFEFAQNVMKGADLSPAGPSSAHAVACFC